MFLGLFNENQGINEKSAPKILFQIFSFSYKNKNYRPWRELKLFKSEKPPNLAIIVDI